LKTRLTRASVLAWRQSRQHLDRRAPRSAMLPVIARLCGLHAQVMSSAELTLWARVEGLEADAVERALWEERALVKTCAMRGTLHLLPADDAGIFLSLLASGRGWELPSWQRYFGMGPKEWEVFRPAVRDALDGEILTREQLATVIAGMPGLEHIGDELKSGWGTLLKPLAWQGDLVFGPSQGNRVTFMSPKAASRSWRGVPEPDEAAPGAIVAYLGAYGPATADGFARWISRGRIAKRSLKSWFAALSDRITEVEVDGERSYVRSEDVDAIAAARPTDAVRFVPGFDEYVLGPGTDDTRIVPAARRRLVSKQSGWIAPVVVAGGVVGGTWEQDGELVRVAWFGESGPAPKKALEAETARLSSLAGRELRVEVTRT
jgi:hypothetical protein